jgi:voltage-gated potassium channel
VDGAEERQRAAGDAGRPHRAIATLDRGERRRRVLFATVRLVAGVVILLWAYYALPFDWDPAVQVLGGVVGSVLLLMGMVLVPLRAVTRAEFPELRAIEATGFTATLAVVLFASIYLTLANADPTAFSETLGHTDALYLSMTTVTTVGFGDVSATSEAARVAVMVQMLVTFAVLGLLVRLVTRVVRRSLVERDGPAGTA